MSASKQIGEVRTIETREGKEYEIKYFVLDADLAAYTPVIGSVPSWVSDSYAVVDSYDKEYLGPGCWILTIRARPRNYDGAGGFDHEYLEKNVKLSFELSEMYFMKEWWGIREADNKDVADAIYNINGSACVKGDYIYKGATSSSAGTADYRKSPFAESGLSLFTILIEKKIKRPVFCVSFFTDDTITALANFVGVNPAVNAFPSKMKPPNVFSSAAGVWRAVSQTVDQCLNRSGKFYYRCTRKFEYCYNAPTIKWDAAKNGGTWKWGNV